jgi:HSP20 family protein
MKPIGIGQIKNAGQTRKRQAAYDGSKAKKEHKPLKPIKTVKTPQEQEGQLSVDVYQTPEEIVIIAPIAGTPSDQLNISITDDVITIKGRRQMPNNELSIKGEDFYIQECFWGKFSRSIVLPAAVDTNNVDAHFKDNVLTIRIPKTERVRTRIIKIDEN